MICPNCKTELVEVNGRYICSGCGREIPENEVMASDWGDGGTVRAGLYGAGTDEPDISNTPVAEYNTSLSESENEETPVPAREPEPAALVEAEEPTVEEVLQQQTATQPAEPVAETGFYTVPQTTTPEPVAPVIPTVPPVISTTPTSSSPTSQIESNLVDRGSIPEVQDSLMQGNDIENTEILKQVQNDVQAIPEVVEPVPDEPVVPTTPETQSAAVPEHTEVVKDMFENTAIATAPDPGIYTDPMYETPLNSEQVQSVATGSSKTPLPADKRLNLIILIAGSILTLLLIIGGVWGYLALSKSNQPTINPVIEEESTVWQELQSVDGGFKISFPDQPETATGTQIINGLESTITNYVYRTDDMTYQAGYALLSASSAESILADTKTTLPKLVSELATSTNLEVSKTKIGNYYTANAIDFTLSNDSASYQGKIMINKQNYILVMAGSESGQTTEYDKFIKSFNFLTQSIQ